MVADPPRSVEPLTENVVEGVVVPTPTLPLPVPLPCTTNDVPWLFPTNNVEVATNAPTVDVPDTREFPWTERREEGVEDPMPTLPDPRIVKSEVEEVVTTSKSLPLPAGFSLPQKVN